MATAHRDRAPKKELWRPCLDDVLTLCARVPRIAAYIHLRCFRPAVDARAAVRADDAALDLAGATARRMGFADAVMADLFRLYLTTHIDVGGGALSGFAVRVVGSTLADPYLA